MDMASLIFIMTLMYVLATGILMLLVVSKRNRLQLTLAGILSVFLVLILVGIINKIQSPTYPALSSPLRFRILATGLVAFFFTMTYYMVAAHRNLLTLRNGILFLSPVLLTFIVYVSWHWGAGVPMDYAYASLAEVWENRFTVPVILRMLMFLFFLLYQVVMIRNMWQLDALRKEHSILNTPDAVSNIRWLRTVVRGIMSIMAVYSLMVFIPSPVVLMLYCVVAAVVLMYFTYNALARPMYEDTEGWQAVWTPRYGWKIIEGTAWSKSAKAPIHPQVTARAEKPNYIAQIDSWMKQEKRFRNAEFSTMDIITQFPDLDNETLGELLQGRAERPQAYIRRHRIEEACRIIRREKAVKASELARRVGFSHPSSFSRAFSTVMGETVVQYMDKVGAERKPKNNVITDNSKK